MSSPTYSKEQKAACIENIIETRSSTVVIRWYFIEYGAHMSIEKALSSRLRSFRENSSVSQVPGSVQSTGSAEDIGRIESVFRVKFQNVTASWNL